MKLLTEINEKLKFDSFDLEFESEMVQARILSTFIEIIEKQNLTQKNLEELTGLKQPFISALFNNRKKLNIEHIALLQKALEVVLQPPSYLSQKEHKCKFYEDKDYYIKDDFFQNENFNQNYYLIINFNSLDENFIEDKFNFTKFERHYEKDTNSIYSY